MIVQSSLWYVRTGLVGDLMDVWQAVFLNRASDHDWSFLGWLGKLSALSMLQWNQYNQVLICRVNVMFIVEMWPIPLIVWLVMMGRTTS